MSGRSTDGPLTKADLRVQTIIFGWMIAAWAACVLAGTAWLVGLSSP
jgi:hypothetical protein